MELNKSKSAVLVLKKDYKTRDFHKDTDIRGVPVKKEFKYLGVVFTDTARKTQFVKGKK